MKITIELELNKDEPLLIRTCSIERVLNNAIEVGSYVQNLSRARDDMAQNGSTLWQDCDMVKPVLRKIWGAISEAVFIEMQKGKK
jgi:hypothetical protein